MSKIDKLNITGIRSFNTQRGETIQFYTPLTLIVGTNGSGKTTIIESLKYVTTGDLPPGAKKGGAFVHDPKLLGEKEVMAQAKLQFKSVHGYRMVITRSLQVTVTKTSRVQKALEGSLLMDRNGEKIVASNRVAELDSIIPQHLGVSQAVLDNVIFCHQEESLWPMSEPLNLKKKFDEIFEAQKYIKAIDNIKAIRKTHNEKLGQYKILEQHAKEDRDRADKARKKSEALSDDIETLRTKCQDFDKKMEQARESADKAWTESESYARILGALEGKRIEAATHEKIIESVKVHLVEVTESDEWLERTIAHFEGVISQYEVEKATKKERWLEWRENIGEHQNDLAQKQTEKGRYEQDRIQWLNYVDRRKTMIGVAAKQHQLRGYDDLTDDGLVEEFLIKIRKVFQDQQAASQRATSNAEIEKREALTNLNRLTERRAALQDNKASAKEQIALNERKAAEIQRKVDKIQINEGSRAIIESRTQEVSAALQRAQDVARTASWEKEIKGVNDQLRLQDEVRSRLDDELMQSTKKAGEIAKLAHFKQELNENQRSLQTLISAHGDRLKQLIREDFNPTNLETVYKRVVDRTKLSLTSAEGERNNATRDMEQVQFKYNSIRNSVASKHQEVSDCTRAVEDLTGSSIADYDAVLVEAQNQVDFARDESKGLGGLADYFGKILQTANDNHTCRVCQRAFKSPGDPALTTFKKKMENLIKKAAVDAEVADLAAAEARYKEVLDAGVAVATWKKLSTEEIPMLESEIDKHRQQKELLVKKVEELDAIVAQRQLVLGELQSISSTVTSIARCQHEITSFSNQIEEFSPWQSGQGSTKTLDEIREEINHVNEDRRRLNKSVARLTADKDASRTEIHQLEIRLRDLKVDLGTADSELEKKAGLIAQVDEYKDLNKKQRNVIAKLDQDVEVVEPEIATAKAKYDDTTTRWKNQIGDLEVTVAKLSDTIGKLSSLNDEIESYISRGGPGQLEAAERDIGTLNESIEVAETAQVQLTREISEVDKLLGDGEKTKRQYGDNLTYRQQTRALEQLNDEISELDSRNAEVDRDRFQRESKRFTDQYHKYSAAREGTLAEMKTKDVQLEELIKDYNTDFKDAPRRFKEAHIKVETTKAAIEDLARYAGALDKAIMRFHAIKMEQVNDIICELWRNTYQGTDVDNIIIRSDPDQVDANGNVKTPSTASTSASRRQYNYRVTMVKQGIEMDMRGRCSAGQRVLACIIIRLALAEVFSSACGIIALDEPTTNLDRDNIEALAKSLHDIIRSRQKQVNFQLLVITHDEDFLRHMDTSEFTDYYYRVSRDGNGDSIIERQDITLVDR